MPAGRGPFNPGSGKRRQVWDKGQDPRPLCGLETMMRARVFGLAAVLLVGAAHGALAQDRDWTPGHRGPVYRRAEPAQTPAQAPQPAPAQAPPAAVEPPQADR